MSLTERPLRACEDFLRRRISSPEEEPSLDLIEMTFAGTLSQYPWRDEKLDADTYLSYLHRATAICCAEVDINWLTVREDSLKLILAYHKRYCELNPPLLDKSAAHDALFTDAIFAILRSPAVRAEQQGAFLITALRIIGLAGYNRPLVYNLQRPPASVWNARLADMEELAWELAFTVPVAQGRSSLPMQFFLQFTHECSGPKNNSAPYIPSATPRVIRRILADVALCDGTDARADFARMTLLHALITRSHLIGLNVHPQGAAVLAEVVDASIALVDRALNPEPSPTPYDTTMAMLGYIQESAETACAWLPPLLARHAEAAAVRPHLSTGVLGLASNHLQWAGFWKKDYPSIVTEWADSWRSHDILARLVACYNVPETRGSASRIPQALSEVLDLDVSLALGSEAFIVMLLADTQDGPDPEHARNLLEVLFDNAAAPRRFG